MIRARIRGHLWTWMFATGAQAKRVQEMRDDDEPEADAWLFALAVRQVLRCVEWAIKHADASRDGSRSTALRGALRVFDSAVPNAIAVRDILSHFDEYDEGNGKLQRDGRPELLMMYSLDGVSFDLILMEGYSITVATAFEAAAKLAEQCFAILD